ncbi:Uncharacterised protein [Porphyromonas macacae]|uniref:Uncharacterized protein n=1 Tax=Porphyromonas macacae TaxID=28115 RepID=A0A379EH09_9PORP|nr:Uncharacterised protein [Porphyromonas macacae]
MMLVTVRLPHPQEVAGFVRTIERVIAAHVAFLSKMSPCIVPPLVDAAVGISQLDGTMFTVEEKIEDMAPLIRHAAQIETLVFVAQRLPLRQDTFAHAIPFVVLPCGFRSPGVVTLNKLPRSSYS